MNLLTTRFLFLDCQTTGMSPAHGDLLEIAWLCASAADSEVPRPHSMLVQLPGDQPIPYRIKEITGLKQEDMALARPPEEVYRVLHEWAKLEGDEATAMIHYAQFERPFLEKLFANFQPEADLPFQILCSAQISRRLFPNIPSRNLRAIAGFFGAPVGNLKRAASHVELTFEIWKELAQELDKNGIRTLAELRTWLNETPSSKKVKEKSKEKSTSPPKEGKEKKYEYRLDRLTRLAFPEKPGVYRMLNKHREILYVGKATSLKSRVNSYFRGQKHKDKKTREMLSQVWDIEFTECETPLEAALLETDEIKRIDPPYNISLKGNRQPAVFFSRQFSSAVSRQDLGHPIGPLRPFGSVEQLRLLSRGLKSGGTIPPIFYEPHPQELVHEGLLEFCRKYTLTIEDLLSVRTGLAFGLKELRQQMLAEAQMTDEVQMTDEEVLIEEILEASPSSDTLDEVPLTKEDMADKFYRLFVRAAAEYRRSRILTRLLNSRVKWFYKNRWRDLEVNHGQLQLNEKAAVTEAAWDGLDLADYDRMSVLLSELSKYPHKIEAPAGRTAQASL